MTQQNVRNLSRIHQHFRVAGTAPDGGLKYESVAPGEEKMLDLAKPDSPHNQARVHAGLIEIGGPTKAAKTKPAE